MREEKLFRAMGEIDGALVEEAASSKQKRSNGWLKFVAVAAGLVFVISALSLLPQQSDSSTELAYKDTEKNQLDTSVNERDTEAIDSEKTEKPLMDFTIAFDGMGYEGIMGYEMLERGNPWKETDEIDVLPIIENNAIYSLQRYSDDVAISQERYEEMEAWLLEAMEFFGIEDCPIDRNRMESVAVNEDIQIEVDGDMNMRIEFLNKRTLPEKFDTSTEATMEETYELAEYILEEYGELFGMENPQITIMESDYTFAGERYHHDAYFYDEGATAAESLLNYCFGRASFSLDDEGKLWFIGISRKDRTSLGEYEIISVEEATKQLLSGEFDTSYYGETVPTAEYIRDVELTYYMSYLDDYKPYYRFWVEVPAEKQENGLNTYVAYYVPAVEGAYVEITFN